MDQVIFDNPELNIPEPLKPYPVYNRIVERLTQRTGGPAQDYVSDNANAIDQINLDITTINANIATLQADIVTINANISSIQTDIENLFALMANLESQVATGLSELAKMINNLYVKVETD